MAADDDGDRSLVERARQGSPEAAEALVSRHWRSSWRVAQGITGDAAAAEDVVQEALIAALRGIDRFDPDRGTFRAWLHRITVNRALNAVRATRRHAGLGEAEGLAGPEHEDPSAAAFLTAVGTLRPAHRAVVVLRYGLDYSPAEIADVLEVPLGTVHSRLARSLEALRQTMEHPNAR